MNRLEANQELLALIKTQGLERPHIVIDAEGGEYELAPLELALDWANNEGERPQCLRVGKASALAGVLRPLKEMDVFSIEIAGAGVALRKHALPAEEMELLRSVLLPSAGAKDRADIHINITKSVLVASLRKREGVDRHFDMVASTVKERRLDRQLVITGIDPDGTYFVSYLADVVALLGSEIDKSRLVIFDFPPDSPIAKAFLTELEPRDVFMLVPGPDCIDLWKFVLSEEQKKDMDRMTPVTRANVSAPVRPDGQRGDGGRAKRPRDESGPALSDTEQPNKIRIDWIWNDGEAGWALSFFKNGDITLGFRHRTLGTQGPAVPPEEFKDRRCAETEHHSVPLSGEALQWIREKVAEAIAARRDKPGVWTMRDLEEMRHSLTLALDEKRKADRSLFGGRPWPEKRPAQGADASAREERSGLIAEEMRRLTRSYGNLAMTVFYRNKQLRVIGEEDDFRAAPIELALRTLLNDGWDPVGSVVFEDVGRTSHGDTAVTHIKLDAGSSLDPAVQLAALQKASEELVKKLNTDPAVPWFRSPKSAAGAQSAAEPPTAEQMLKRLLELSRMKVEAVEATGPLEAVGRVEHEGAVKTVTAEVAEENSGLWANDPDPSHPQRFVFSGGVPIHASKADAVGASFVHVIFSHDGRSAVILLGKDVKKHGMLRPAASGHEATYLLPLSQCIVVHAGRSGDWHLDDVLAPPAPTRVASNIQDGWPWETKHE